MSKFYKLEELSLSDLKAYLSQLENEKLQNEQDIKKVKNLILIKSLGN